MERLKELMAQLKEQIERKADPSQMLQTAQLLEAELRHLASQPAPVRVVPTKIAVMMPSSAKIVADPSPALEVHSIPESIPIAPVTASATAISAAATPMPASAPLPAAAPIPAAAPMPAAAAGPLASPAYAPVPVSAGIAAAAPINGAASPLSNGSPASPVINGAIAGPASAINGAATQTAIVSPAAVASPAPVARTKEPERGTWPFDPLAEKPTDRFTLSQKSREINDVIGNGNGASSLNEKLKSDVVELKSALNDTPVRDLKKAIGVNDRYVFISQLFRGDEVMYERSLKTINGFRILPEAEYWMERELKVKLGWDENREATRHFYQLVKRRFS